MSKTEQQPEKQPCDMHSVRHSLNGNLIDRYDEIPDHRTCKSPIMMPGVYCRNCGNTFALYQWSFHKPDGFDENGKFYYNKCFGCA